MKKKILISTLDNKFIDELINLLSNYFDIKIDIFQNNKDEDRLKWIKNTDIIFCEWCEINALWYSNHKKTHQKLFIRLHRYELFSYFFYNINWKNVDNLIFISPEIKILGNKFHIINKYINKNNFDWKFYLNNNLFYDNNNEYNLDWAWNHWINIGNKKIWDKPSININYKIKDNSVCDEFKHFNGGIVLYNYVKNKFFNYIKKENDNFNIGIIGILPKLKRVDIAIDIIEELIKIDNRYKLYILGKNYYESSKILNNISELSYYKKIESRIDNSDLKNYIIFDGFTKSVELWLNKIGYLLSVSDIEGSHHSVAEAMATGTIPFIYGNALKKYKLDKIYPIEYCFYDSDIKNLCSKIIYYSKNINIKNKKSIECREFAKKKFNLNNIFERYQNIFYNI